jgi:hypothetical protein
MAVKGKGPVQIVLPHQDKAGGVLFFLGRM